jgi:hypothetical protein
MSTYIDSKEADWYTSTKTIALGFADIPLLTTNISQITRAALVGHKYMPVIVSLASVSIGLQLIVFLILVILWAVPLHGATPAPGTTGPSVAAVNPCAKITLAILFCFILAIALVNISISGFEQYTVKENSTLSVCERLHENDANKN